MTKEDCECVYRTAHENANQDFRLYKYSRENYYDREARTFDIAMFCAQADMPFRCYHQLMVDHHERRITPQLYRVLTDWCDSIRELALDDFLYKD